MKSLQIIINKDREQIKETAGYGKTKKICKYIRLP